ncbi:DUF6377 domain-containing protein [Chitinophaga costaii]|nr:DUF6377 domain-containing protein [Chitinophaga costaii]
MKVLKTELNREHVYEVDKQKRINQLQAALLCVDSTDFDAQLNLYTRIYEEYHSYKFDSAMVYSQKILTLSKKFGKADELIQHKISQGNMLLKAGFYKEAFDNIRELAADSIPETLKSDFLNFGARLNAGIAEYDNDAYFSWNYKQQSAEYVKKAKRITPYNEFEHTINLAFQPDSVKQKKLTPDFFYHYIMRQQLPEHSLAMVATRISYAFTGQDRIFFLALAAINDIRSSTKETLAIFLLGQELFNLNKTNDAFLLLQEAVRNAKFYGARNRAVQIESLLPMVAAKLIDEQQHERDKLLIGILVFLIVAVVLLFLLVIYRRQFLQIKANDGVIKEKNSELESVNEKLWEASKIKEELIGLFFKTCSSYIEMLDKVKLQTQHNIKLGKYNDVNQFLNDVHIEEEKGQLYNMLDTVFLTMFPNFITSFNALLKKEDQIWPKTGETLNATLRIFALMRLGINEQEVIAKILDYSVSTVYTYKMRVKSRALVPANDFERKIMDIKFIDDDYPN